MGCDSCGCVQFVAGLQVATGYFDEKAGSPVAGSRPPVIRRYPLAGPWEGGWAAVVPVRAASVAIITFVRAKFSGALEHSCCQGSFFSC
jgi:hypothetical protein